MAWFYQNPLGGTSLNLVSAFSLLPWLGPAGTRQVALGSWPGLRIFFRETSTFIPDYEIL